MKKRLVSLAMAIILCVGSVYTTNAAEVADAQEYSLEENAENNVENIQQAEEASEEASEEEAAEADIDIAPVSDSEESDRLAEQTSENEVADQSSDNADQVDEEISNIGSESVEEDTISTGENNPEANATEDIENVEKAIDTTEDEVEAISEASVAVEENDTVESVSSPISYSEHIDGYIVKVDAEEGVFPEETKVVIKTVSDETNKEIEQKVNEELDEDRFVTGIVTFDISFIYQDKEIEPDGAVNVVIKLDKEMLAVQDETDTAEIVVYHVDDEIENVEEVECVDKNGLVEFEGEEFSLYSIIITDEELGHDIDGVCGDNLTWSLVKDGTLTISGTGEMYRFGHGQYWDEETETYIELDRDNPWGNYASAVKKLVINEGITSISAYAFSGCNFENELVIPNSVTKIGNNAFYECRKATGNLVIPNGVKRIEYNAFRYYGATGTLKLPNSLEYIGSDAFWEAKLTGELKLPETLKSIGSYAFYSCNGLKGDLIFPEGMEEIESDAFDWCSGFDGIAIIPSTVTSIGGGCINGCSNLVQVINNSNVAIGLPSLEDDYWVNEDNQIYEINSITRGKAIRYSNHTDEVGKDIGGECGDNLKWLLTKDGTLTISGTGEMYRFGHGQYWDEETETYIELDRDNPWGNYASAVKKLVINEGVTSISAYAFSGCNFENELVIPNSVTKIGDNAFYECRKATGNLVIPNGVKRIEYNAFRYYGATGTLKLPNSLEYIGSDAFWEAKLTGELKLPETLKSIGSYAFYSCNGLKGDLIFPEGMEEIESDAFDWCSGFDGIAIIPSTVTSIGGGCINGCSNLVQVINNSNVAIGLPSLEDDYWVNEDNQIYEINSITRGKAIRYSNHTDEVGKDIGGECGDNLKWLLTKDGTLTISGTGEMYRFGHGQYWDEETETYIELDRDNPWGNYASAVKKLVINEGITSISPSAFAYCNFENELVIPNSVTKIGDNAFYECKKATGNLVIPNGVKRIEYSAFRYYGATGTLKLPNSLEYIGSAAFWDAELTGELKLPETLKSIGSYAFYNCNGLKGDLIFPEGMEEIESDAFDWCSGFDGIAIIPSTVTSIGGGCINGCSNLVQVINNSNVAIGLPKSEDEFWVDLNNPAFEVNSITNGKAAKKCLAKFYDEEEELYYQAIYAGDKVARPFNPKKDGYEFMGWFTGNYYWNQTEENLFDFNKPITRGTRLYAGWLKQGDENKTSTSINTYEEVPASLRGEYSTVEELEEGMLDKIKEHYTDVNYEASQLFDVKLKISYNGGDDWAYLTSENFPKEGVEVTLEFPEGTNYLQHKFFVSHMFESAVNGYNPGDVEFPSAYVDSKGIHFRVMGLSPIMVVWRDKTPEEILEDNKNSGNNDQPSNNPIVIPGLENGNSNITGGATVIPVSWWSGNIIPVVGLSDIPELNNESYEQERNNESSSNVVVIDLLPAALDNAPWSIAVVKQEQGLLCKMAFALGRPAGYSEAFSFNIANGGKCTYENKNGKFTLTVPFEYRKAGRKFAVVGVDRFGISKLFTDIDTDDSKVTVMLDIDGYAFDLIYTDDNNDKALSNVIPVENDITLGKSVTNNNQAAKTSTSKELAKATSSKPLVSGKVIELSNNSVIDENDNTNDKQIREVLLSGNMITVYMLAMTMIIFAMYILVAVLKNQKSE